MGEGAMELVWMEVGQAGLTATTPQHLNQAPGGQAAASHAGRPVRW
jgi:hypothetical protein